MNNFDYPSYPPQSGYMTEQIRTSYIKKAIDKKLLPENAHRMEPVISLVASNDTSRPIQFWQLYSVMGAQRIVAIVRNFYERVYADEAWFTSVFQRIAVKERHIQTQSSMWLDVMGGGFQYHGGEFRLNFHHTHNAMELMTDKGAQRWAQLMAKTLNDPAIDYTSDHRVRPAVNTFLGYFMGKYAEQFSFSDDYLFGETNAALTLRINFSSMTSDQIEALSEEQLIEGLKARKIDVSQMQGKSALVNKALNLF